MPLKKDKIKMNERNYLKLYGLCKVNFGLSKRHISCTERLLFLDVKKWFQKVVRTRVYTVLFWSLVKELNFREKKRFSPFK